MTDYTREHVAKMIQCAPLLPAPGDVEVAGLARAYLALLAERDELRLVLLAEQGGPAGAPSGGWSMGGDGSWRKGGAPGTDTTYRVVSFVAPARHGRAAVRAWRVRPAGGADIGGEAPTAREAMQAADAAEGEQQG